MSDGAWGWADSQVPRELMCFDATSLVTQYTQGMGAYDPSPITPMEARGVASYWVTTRPILHRGKIFFFAYIPAGSNKLFQANAATGEIEQAVDGLPFLSTYNDGLMAMGSYIAFVNNPTQYNSAGPVGLLKVGPLVP